MRCEQVRQYFDAYLDGELSPSQVTELGAHRLQCPDCRRALALMEVSGHIIAFDRDPVEAPEGFSDRLLACVEASQSSWRQRMGRWLYVGAPLSAAAVIILAFAGVFNRPGSRDARVLGKKEVLVPAPSDAPSNRIGIEPGRESAKVAEAARLRGEQWLREFRDNVDTVERLNLTVLQWMEFLKESQSTLRNDLHAPALDSEGSTGPAKAADDEPDDSSDIEDL